MMNSNKAVLLYGITNSEDENNYYVYCNREGAELYNYYSKSVFDLENALEAFIDEFNL